MTIRGNFVIEEGAKVGDNLDTGYNVVIRAGVVLGNDVKIWSNSVVDAGATVGNNVRIHCNCYISQNVVIEDEVYLAPGVNILNDRYPPRTDPKDWESPILRRGCSIGGGVTIGPGVEIGEGALIGAGAVVIRDVPPNQVWAGVPAKRIR